MAMAYKPPDSFDFSKGETWPNWIRRFERFRTLTELNEKDDITQINTLIYTMGDQAEDILNSFKLNATQLKDYKTVKEKFDSYFVVRRNVIYERAKFNRRVQNEHESVEEFITSLHVLAEHCEYGDLHDQMIRDRIVVGLIDANVSQKLQLDSDLTLKKAQDIVRETDAVKKQQSELRNKADFLNNDIDFIRSTKHKKSRREQNNKATGKSNQKDLPSKQSCFRCGKNQYHSREKCPAKNSICNKCSKVGHWAKVCRTKVVAEVVKGNSDDDANSYEFLGEVSSQNNAQWKANLKLNGQKVYFKLDTGADETCIPLCTYESMKSKLPVMKKSKKELHACDGKKLDICGRFTVTIETDEKITVQDVYVIKGLHHALLGGPAIRALNLFQKTEFVETVKTSDEAEPNKKWKNESPKLFKGLGRIKNEYTIKLKSDAQPYAVNTPRKIAHPRLPKVKKELNRMEKMGVISKIETYTEWCSHMVVVPKPNGDVRICLDPSKLNENILRETHPLPSVDYTLAKLAGSTVFTKLDCNSGFWQIPLSEESAPITTFITPWGRYHFNVLPFGITPASEHFQKQLEMILKDCEGVCIEIDDILVHGKGIKEHDERLKKVLQKLEAANVTLNSDKCEFSKPEVHYLGHVINATGISADPEKVRAITEMSSPNSIQEVRRFLGMCNQLSKFSSELADKTKPIRDLLSEKSHWNWGIQQEEAFKEIKKILSDTPVLALYDPKAKTKIRTDASSYGLGAILMQKQSDRQWQPVAYASRALSPTEQRYAQIEKEALGITWGCEKFSEYISGMKFHIETDHKPLIPIFTKKSLNDMSPRIQRFRMRIMRFTYTISHVQGKDLVCADTLSRSPIRDKVDEDILDEEAKGFVDQVLKELPITEDRLNELRVRLKQDDVCEQVMKYCTYGWPDKNHVNDAIKPYWQHVGDLTIQDGLLLHGKRLVIPSSMRLDILSKIHSGHLGITKCRERARMSVWWPGMSKQIDDLVRNCNECVKERKNKVEPLISSILPDRPWQKLCTDLFELNGKTYLIIVDYFSRYPEIALLNSTTSTSVITHMKSCFARHGIPDIVMSDNGTQFSSNEFSKFTFSYGFKHQTSSPRYPQANGEIERAVKTVKSLLKKSKDPYIALMAYRATPLENGYSPAELLFGRKIQTTLPLISHHLVPTWPYLGDVRKKEERIKKRQKTNYDFRHKVKPLQQLEPDCPVWIPDRKESGTIVKKFETPRSYVVKTPTTMVRRNRRHLIEDPSRNSCQEPQETMSPTSVTAAPENNSGYYTRSGRLSVPPDRLVVGY